MLGPAYQDQGLVCARPHGTPMCPSELTAGFAAAIRKSDLPKVRFHDLRLGHATMLLKQQVHPKIVSERLGHATVGITLDVYSHVLPDMQEEAARRIDTVIRTAVDA
jgi:integrase